MNALLSSPPTALNIDGTEYKINYDYRTCLKIILAYEDEELTGQEKTQVMLELLYEIIPDDVEQAISKALWFLDCGESTENTEQYFSHDTGRLYSFSHDAKYIFSAVRYTHGLDLDEHPNLHWWKFNYLMFDLDDGCFFNRIIYFRRQKSLGKLTQDEWKVYNEMAHVFELPIRMTAADRAADDEFMSLLNGGDLNGENC